MTTVTDAITEYLADLERLQDAPVEPFGFGADLACADDLTEDMAERHGTEDALLVLGEALLRRLDCPRGQLPDDPSYGYDIRGDLNRGLTADEVRSLAGRIRNECERDDRVERATVTLTTSPTGSSLDVQIRVTPKDPAARRSFPSLTVGVSWTRNYRESRLAF